MIYPRRSASMPIALALTTLMAVVSIMVIFGQGKPAGANAKVHGAASAATNQAAAGTVRPRVFAYYYLWYFSAAQLALPLGLTGWEADIAMTWFSAFASLTLLIGLACWFGQSRSAAIWAVLLAVFGLRHPVIYDDSELGSTRTKLGWLALVLLVLSFTLTPIRSGP